MMKKISSNIWVLTDSRTGNTMQAIAVAENLNMKFEIKCLEYNILAGLPNFLLGSSNIYITKNTKESLITDQPPKLIIAAGRRAAGVALYLKKHYKDVKLVQIMKPDRDSKLFDMIVLPQHDKFNDNGTKILRTIGAINNIRSKLTENIVGQDSFLKYYPAMTKFIGVLIGGNTKEYKFGYNDAENLSTIVENMITYSGISAFITFSRRTPDIIKKLFREKFQEKNIIYDPTIEDSNSYNPYLGILKNAKFLIITCDSVSMCSEAASSGKPLYIYTPEKFTSKKHKYFTHQLIDLGIARNITIDSHPLEEYKYSPLNEVEKVVRVIKELL